MAEMPASRQRLLAGSLSLVAIGRGKTYNTRMPMPKPLFPTLVSCAAAALALALPAAVCRAQDIPVGEFASLTGNNATFGVSSHDGTALAIDEINARGGVLNGEKLRLTTEDDRSMAGEPANIVRKLISSDKVVAVLGEVASSKSLEAAPICQTSRVPMISPASTNPKVTEIGDYIFRVCFLDEFQGKVIARYALDTSQGQERRAAARREAGLQHGPGAVHQGRLHGRRWADRHGKKL